MHGTNSIKYNSKATRVSPDISEHSLIKRFIKGVFNTKALKPRYTYTWDINKVLPYTANLGCNDI